MNLYANLQDIKQLIGFNGDYSQNDQLDAQILAAAGHYSRWADQFCSRRFYIEDTTKHFDVDRIRTDYWFPDFVSITTLSFSDDNGATYTAYAASDYYAMISDSYSDPSSYNRILLSRNGNYSNFSTGQRSIKFVGSFGYATDRDRIWLDSNDEVEDNPLSDSATTLTVNDADGIGPTGAIFRFQIGQTIRIGSEQIYISDIDYSKNTISIVRAQNGTTAASHAQNTQIDLFSPPDPLKKFVINNTFNFIKRVVELNVKETKASNKRDAGLTRFVNPDEVISTDLIRPLVRLSI